MENFTTTTEKTDLTAEVTQDTQLTDAETNNYILNGFKKLKKLKVSDCGLYPVAKINKGSNIRNENKLVKSLPPLLQSIADNGISTPLQINLEGTLIDGFRRYACAIKLELIEVPVLVIDIPDSEIPFYQYLTMEREGIDESERGVAVFNYTLLNPELIQLDIAKKFSVSPEFVSRAARIIQKGEIIIESVVKGVITPTTAWNIVDNAIESNFLQVEDILEDKLNAISIAEENPEGDTKPVKSVTLKTLNQELTKAGLQPINKETKVKEQTPKAFDKEKVLSFLECLELKNQGEFAVITGVINIEIWEYIQSLIAKNKKFNITTITVRDIEDELSAYTDNTQNGECFLQTSSNEYTSFNPLLAEYGLPLIVENQLEKIKVSKSQLNSIVTKIQMDVTIINVAKYKITETRGRKKTKINEVSAETLSPEDVVEFEADIQTGILHSLEQTYQTETKTTELQPEVINIPDERTEVTVLGESQVEDNIDTGEELKFTDLIFDTNSDTDEEMFSDDDVIEIKF